MGGRGSLPSGILAVGDAGVDVMCHTRNQWWAVDDLARDCLPVIALRWVVVGRCRHGSWPLVTLRWMSCVVRCCRRRQWGVAMNIMNVDGAGDEDVGDGGKQGDDSDKSKVL